MQNTIDYPELKIHIQEMNNHAIYTFKGHIAASFRHNTLPRSKTPKVTFDLKGVELVSSVGLREWALLVRLWGKDQELYYEKCSICFVDQLNMVHEMVGSAKVVSFYAPFYCEPCDKEHLCLIDTKTHHKQLSEAILPQFRCSCEEKKTLEFDALPNYYLSFLKKPS